MSEAGQRNSGSTLASPKSRQGCARSTGSVRRSSNVTGTPCDLFKLPRLHPLCSDHLASHVQVSLLEYLYHPLNTPTLSFHSGLIHGDRGSRSWTCFGSKRKTSCSQSCSGQMISCIVCGLWGGNEADSTLCSYFWNFDKVLGDWEACCSMLCARLRGT